MSATAPRYRHWRLEVDADELAWLSFDRAGETTNSFSRETIEELLELLAELTRTPPRGLVLRSAKDNFIAGADVREFARFAGPEEAWTFARLGWEMTRKFADLPFPTTAAINGFCMGGGLELALACRYRVALDDARTRLALPEVMLGIWPAWHGLTRLPRLVGPRNALDMLLTGRAVDARRARRIGLVDEAVPLRIFERTAKLLTLEAPARPSLPLLERLLLGPLRPLAVRQARRRIAQRARPEHYPAPYAMLKAWQRYDGDAMRAQDDPECSIRALAAHPSTRNLLRVFFLRERLRNLAREAEGTIAHVHVVGAGVMGGDIAAVCAAAGLRVTLQDTSAERIGPALGRAAKLFERRLREVRLVRDALDRLIPDAAGAGLARADLVIEAIYENLEAKRSLFATLEARARPQAVLATNTSSLEIAAIGAALRDPARLVGIHFFNPVPQMMLVEIVSAPATDAAVARRAAAFVRAIDKLPLPVKDSPGFLVNRVLGPYLANAFRMLDEGIRPETIDAAMEAFGMPMGPMELADTVGLDICLAAGRELGRKFGPAAARAGDGGDIEPPRALVERVALGHLGKKSGIGIYRYERGRPVKAKPEAHYRDLIEPLIEPYLAEAQAVLAEGVVADAELVDAGLVFGTGFAPFRGGPLHYLAQRDRR